MAENGGSQIKEICTGAVLSDAPIAEISDEKKREKGGTKTAWRKLATGSGSMPVVQQGRKQSEGPVMGAESWPALADARPKSNNGNSGGKFTTDVNLDRKIRDVGPKTNPLSSSNVPAQVFSRCLDFYLFSSLFQVVRNPESCLIASA